MKRCHPIFISYITLMGRMREILFSQIGRSWEMKYAVLQEILFRAAVGSRTT
jgi:hypothetical protein